MKKKYILFSFIVILFAILSFNTKSYATELDEIVNYVVTVDPRMNDGTLDITYEITWKVLDSTTEGPLSWVKIGTPNSYFDTPTALTNNIKKISAYSGSYVRIDFVKKYYEGQQVTFKYSIHQSNMYKLSMFSNCSYKFTPAWFTDAKVDNLKIRWNSDGVKKSDSKYTEDNYLVWTKVNMSKGSKMTINVKYDKKAFSSLDSSKQRTNTNSGSSFNSMIIIYIIIIVFICVLSLFGGGGYYSHRGFYGGYYGRGYYGGCVHSSCACAHSSCACAHSCACACAGSGRAGCSKKDFYRTNLTSKKIKNVLKD